MELEQDVALYIEKLKDLPLLTHDRERELSRIIQGREKNHFSIVDEVERNKSRNADKILEKAVEELVNHNLRLVIKEAFKFSKATGIDVKDLIGSGNVGLVKAAYLYNVDSHDNRFSTYAMHWIRRELFCFVHTNGLVTVPTHIINARYKHDKLAQNGITDDNEVMEAMDITESELKRIKDLNISVISLNKQVSGYEDNDNMTLGDIIPDEKAVDPAEEAQEIDKYKYLHEALAELDEISRDIVTCQIMGDDKTNLNELGQRYGKSGERIRQIKDKALKALRKKIEYKIKYGK